MRIMFQVSAVLLALSFFTGCGVLAPEVKVGDDGRRWRACTPRTMTMKCADPTEEGGVCTSGNIPVWSGDVGCGPDGRMYLD